MIILLQYYYVRNSVDVHLSNYSRSGGHVVAVALPLHTVQNTLLVFVTKCNNCARVCMAYCRCHSNNVILCAECWTCKYYYNRRRHGDGCILLCVKYYIECTTTMYRRSAEARAVRARGGGSWGFTHEPRSM